MAPGGVDGEESTGVSPEKTSRRDTASSIPSFGTRGASGDTVDESIDSASKSTGLSTSSSFPSSGAKGAGGDAEEQPADAPGGPTSSSKLDRNQGSPFGKKGMSSFSASKSGGSGASLGKTGTPSFSAPKSGGSVSPFGNINSSSFNASKSAGPVTSSSFPSFGAKGARGDAEEQPGVAPGPMSSSKLGRSQGSPFGKNGVSSFSASKSGGSGASLGTTGTPSFSAPQSGGTVSPFGKTGSSSFSASKSTGPGTSSSFPSFGTKGAGGDSEEQPADASGGTTSSSKLGGNQDSPFGKNPVPSFRASESGGSGASLGKTGTPTFNAPKSGYVSPFGKTGSSSFQVPKSGKRGESGTFGAKGARGDAEEQPAEAAGGPTLSSKGRNQGNPFGKDGIPSFSASKSGGSGAALGKTGTPSFSAPKFGGSVSPFGTTGSSSFSAPKSGGPSTSSSFPSFRAKGDGGDAEEQLADDVSDATSFPERGGDEGSEPGSSQVGKTGSSSFRPSKSGGSGAAFGKNGTPSFPTPKSGGSRSPFGKNGSSSFSAPKSGGHGTSSSFPSFGTKGAGCDAEEQPSDAPSGGPSFANLGSERSSQLGKTGSSSFRPSKSGGSGTAFGETGAPSFSTPKSGGSGSPFGKNGSSSFSPPKTGGSDTSSSFPSFGTPGTGGETEEQPSEDDVSGVPSSSKLGGNQGSSPFGKNGLSSISASKSGGSASPFGTTGSSSFSATKPGGPVTSSNSPSFGAKGARGDAEKQPANAADGPPSASKMGRNQGSPFGKNGMSSFSASKSGGSGGSFGKTGTLSFSAPKSGAVGTSSSFPSFGAKGAAGDPDMQTADASDGSVQGTGPVSPFGKTGASSFSPPKASPSFGKTGMPSSSTPMSSSLGMSSSFKGAARDTGEKLSDSTSSTSSFQELVDPQIGGTESPQKTSPGFSGQSNSGKPPVEPSGSSSFPSFGSQGASGESGGLVGDLSATPMDSKPSESDTAIEDVASASTRKGSDDLSSPADSGSPGWYNAPVELDWGIEETGLPEPLAAPIHSKTPIAETKPTDPQEKVVQEEQRNSKSPSWDPHGAVDSSTVDIMNTYSSSNGEWWAPSRTSYQTLDSVQSTSKGSPWSSSSVAGDGVSDARTAEANSGKTVESEPSTRSPSQPDETTVDLMTSYSSNNGEWWAPARTTFETIENDRRAQRPIESSASLPPAENPGKMKADLTIDPNYKESSNPQDALPDDPEAADSALIWPTNTDEGAVSGDEASQEDARYIEPLTGGTPTNWYNMPVDKSFFGLDPD
eukprot:scaffold1087_cov136-Cylindrotheca_fusiformis.AAC.6